MLGYVGQVGRRSARYVVSTPLMNDPQRWVASATKNGMEVEAKKAVHRKLKPANHRP